MFKKICLLSCHNLYESKRHFTEKFAEALRRHNIQTEIFSWPYGPIPDGIIQDIQLSQPDLTCSFHQLPAQNTGGYFWEALKIPHWTILVDPVFYDLELMRSSLSIISCVDRSDCALLNSYQFKRTFFFPHAIERELIQPPNLSEQRPLDVIMLGTCYDPDHLRKFWKNSYSKAINEVLDEASERVLSNPSTTFVQALLQALVMQGIDPHEVEFDQLAYYVDSFTRGLERLELIRSIKHSNIHVFGGTCWREEKPIADWSYYLSKQSNVTIHPPVNFGKAIELLKKSKICLNSMPFFKNGTHERIFTSLACGALPVTNDSTYMCEFFEDGKDLLFHQFNNFKLIDEQIQRILSNEKKRIEIVCNGQEKVRQLHTWDCRAEEAIAILPQFL